MSASIIPLRPRNDRPGSATADVFAAELDDWTARVRRRLDGLDEGSVSRAQLCALVVAGTELCDIAAEVVWTLAAELEQVGADPAARRTVAELTPRVQRAHSALAAAGLAITELGGH